MVYLTARAFRVPVVLSGQTIGPLNNRRDSRYARRVLSKAQLITLRDIGTSRSRLHALGVRGPVVLETADDAIDLPAVSKDQALSALYKEEGSLQEHGLPELLVAMNLKGSLRLYKDPTAKDSELDHEIEVMAGLADRLIDHYGATLLLIPTGYGVTTDDRDLHRRLVSMVRSPESIVPITGEYTAPLLKGLIALCDFAVGIRYHFCVFAASSTVPFLGMASGIYQRTKLKGLADLCDLPDAYYPEDLATADVGSVWKHLVSCMSIRETTKAHLLARIPVLVRRSQKSTDHAIGILRAKYPDLVHPERVDTDLPATGLGRR